MFSVVGTTTANSGMRRSLISVLTAAMLAVAMVLGGGAPVVAQQGTIASPPPLTVPSNQGRETSTNFNPTVVPFGSESSTNHLVSQQKMISRREAHGAGPPALVV